MPRFVRSAGLAVALAVAGCLGVRYVGQAGFGQLDLWTRSRAIDEVLADPDTDERTRVLLAEVGHVLAFARAHGLDPKRSYERYVELDGEGVVWFVTASRPLAFEPKIWSFPIVGGFPYLGWFSQKDAVAFARALARDGWDVYARPTAAYSTGGWLRDPVLSTMFSPGDDAIRSLANVLLHELVHANVLVEDQAVWNESVATFVGDEMTADYLAARYGADAGELAAYRLELAEADARAATLHAAYRELDAIYRGGGTDADKRAAKRRVLARLDDELVFDRPPNNAYLMQFQTYNAGLASFRALREACGRDWRRFLAAVRRVKASDFQREQQEELEPVLARQLSGNCPTDTCCKNTVH